MNAYAALDQMEDLAQAEASQIHNECEELTQKYFAEFQRTGEVLEAEYTTQDLAYDMEETDELNRLLKVLSTNEPTSLLAMAAIVDLKKAMKREGFAASQRLAESKTGVNRD